MLQKKHITQQLMIYITANSLMDGGRSLKEALRLAKEAGVDGFELRRELLPTNIQSKEIIRLRAQLSGFRSPPIYSTPQSLFSETGFQAECVRLSLAEADALGCGLVKFSPGRLEHIEDASLTQFSSLQSKFPNMMIAVENGQQPETSNIARWVRFFERVTALDCPIGMTFDLGNWSCCDVDTVRAASSLAPYVIYIHVKAVERKETECISLPILESSLKHAALSYLPATVPRAIEFPVAPSTRSSLIKAISTYAAWLRSGKFATQGH